MSHRLDRRARELGVWVALTMAYVVLRSWRLTEHGLWFDEVFSVQAARLSWSSLMPFLAADAVHPPLFYALLKLWVSVGGTGLLWLKLLPVLLSGIALVPIYLLSRDLKLTLGDSAVLLWLMTVNVYLVHHAQELRMYSLLFSLTLLSVWLFLSFLVTADASLPRLFWLFTVDLLLVYTHYFGWLVVGTQGLCVLIWRRRQLVPFTILTAVLLASFLPWVHAVLSVAESGSPVPQTLRWIGRPGLAELAWYPATLNGPLPYRHTTSIGLVLFATPVALLAFHLVRRTPTPSSRELTALCLFSAVPVLVAFVASYVLSQSVWGNRHLIVSAGPYLLLVVLALSRTAPDWVRIVLLTLAEIMEGSRGWGDSV
jgi:hypothetical protein